MPILGVFKVGAPMKPHEDNDEANLARKAKEGDMNAFESLIKKHQQAIYYLCRRLTGAHQSADDIAQETFIKAYFALAAFDENLALYPWLRKIAVNTALNYIKSRRREKALGDGELKLASANSQAGRESPQHYLEREELEERFHRALDSLPPGQKSVFVLRFYENQSYGEIARALRLSPGTVMSRLNRARRKLKALLADSFFRERRR
jgi:RNA polymerase sigma-70 factor (ECF subfamily)